MNALSILPLLSAVCTLTLGIFVLAKNRKDITNVIFFLFSLFVSVWLGNTAFVFMSCSNEKMAIFWDRLVYFGVIFIPPTCYHFSALFSGIKKNKYLIALGYIISTFFFAISRTDLFVSQLIYYPWGCHTKAHLFHNLFVLSFAFFITLVFINLAKGLKKSTGIQKIQIKYILVAFIILGFGVFGFLPAYGINLYPFTYLAGLIAVVIITYAILRHHLMNIKVITTEIFSILVSLVLLINALLSKSLNNFILNFSLFLAISFFSVLLIRSVLKEVKTREELAALTEKLQAANEDLKKLDKAKSEFISIASHQLRTPLSIIKGFASMLEEGSYVQMNEKAKDILGKIGSSSDRLTRLINDLLDLSRMEGGRMKFEWEFIKMDELVQSVVEELAPQAEKKGVNFKWLNQTPEKMYVRADKEKLRQVVMNLIDNAIKYTPKGFVEVKLVKTPENMARLAVKDSGIGMDQEEINMIFGKFMRGKKVPRLWTEGVGLGLYVARKILEEHKGNVWAESEGEGKGSTFFVEIPVY